MAKNKKCKGCFMRTPGICPVSCWWENHYKDHAGPSDKPPKLQKFSPEVKE